VLNFTVEKNQKAETYSQKLVKKVKFSVLICFEDIFPEIARQFVKNGASFLVNITNDAWFGNSCAPYQHVQSSVFRAVENRVNVVRAANTGLSCFIDQKGRIFAAVRSGGKSIFVDGFKADNIVLTRTRTFYTRYGEVFAYLCILISILYILFRRQKKAIF
jgi:apolipoprotein N-acyltransferase